MPEPLDLDISFSSRRWLEALPDVEDRCHRAAQAAFGAAGPDNLGGAEVSIVLGDDEQVRALNRTYRGMDKSTNVLSFANIDSADLAAVQSGGGAPVLLGDIIVAYGVAVAEACAEAKSLADHLSHLVVHGTLHLLGYDHQDDSEADRMEQLERSVLGRLGVDDPYAERPADGRKNGAAAS